MSIPSKIEENNGQSEDAYDSNRHYKCFRVYIENNGQSEDAYDSNRHYKCFRVYIVGCIICSILGCVLGWNLNSILTR